jgi:hypothetical protein
MPVECGMLSGQPLMAMPAPRPRTPTAVLPQIAPSFTHGPQCNYVPYALFSIASDKARAPPCGPLRDILLSKYRANLGSSIRPEHEAA